MGRIKLEYLDHRKIYFPKLTYYKSGLGLPNEHLKNQFWVTESEAEPLLKQRNGSIICYKKVGKDSKKLKEEIEIEKKFVEEHEIDPEEYCEVR
jgi:hypothetical protein